MGVVLYAGSHRSSTAAPGRSTLHSFSFGGHYDPDNLGFGALVCHNDERLEPGAGYPDHPHSGLEIVTWVLEGALVHTASDGSRCVVEAGRSQVLSSGSGIVHSEIADAASGRCRFVQAWLRSDDPGGRPAHVLGDAPHLGDGLVVVAGGDVLPVRTAGATLSVAALEPGRTAQLPDAPRVHVFAASGSVVVGGRAVGGRVLGAGDAVRITDEPGQSLLARERSEVLVWSLPG